MSNTQPGIYKLTLYENKEFDYSFDSNDDILLSSLSNSGDVVEYDTDNNFIRYSNDLKPSENNTVINDHLIALAINGITQTILENNEKLQSSIYGWIPVIEYMDNQQNIILAPFFPRFQNVNTQVSHTFNVDLKPRIFTTKALQLLT